MPGSNVNESDRSKRRREEPLQMYEGDPQLDSVIESGHDRNWLRRLHWLAGGIFIFILLYCSSYLALLWLPPFGRMDMKSHLVADYNAWAFIVFQPVDPAIIQEIVQERELPEQIIIDGESWPTPASTLAMPATPGHTATSTPQPTSDDLASSPTASEPPYTSTSVPTSTISRPESTATPQPPATANPTKSRKPPKTPRTPKPHKTPKN